MIFSRLLTTAIFALAGGVLPTTVADTSSTQSPLDVLATNIRAHNAAVNSTISGYRAGSITLDQAAGYIRGNLSTTSGLVGDFKTTVSGLMSGFNASDNAIGPGGVVPAGRYSSKELPQRMQRLTDAFGDQVYTLAQVQDDPGLSALVMALEYAVDEAKFALTIALFLVTFVYDELFVPGGYPWGIALPY